MGRTFNQSDDDALPVFVFPNSLYFYCNEPQSLKQILTLYNPYDFTIRFKVLSTAPWKYNVIEPEGFIRPRSCLDITVRLLDATLSNMLKEDKFRVQMKREDKVNIQGKREVSAQLLERREDNLNEGKESDVFEQMNPSSSFHQTKSSLRGKRMDESFESISTTGRLERSNGSKTHIFYIFAAIICGIILALPSGERGSRLPEYLHVTSTLKIIVAYVLGLITSIICKLN